MTPDDTHPALGRGPDRRAREAFLREWLSQHPDDAVVAIRPDGIFTTMPAGLPLDRQRVVEGPTTVLDMVIPSERPKVIEAWERTLREGGATVNLHSPGAGQEGFGVHFIDVTHRYGVLVGLFAGLPVEDRAGRGLDSLVPRWSTMRKDGLALIMAVDDATTAILGWSAEELIGHRNLELIHPDDEERAIANWVTMLGRPGASQRVRLRHRHRDGSYRWLEVTNHNHLDDPDDPHVLADMVDVSDEVTFSEALRANEQLLRRLTEALPVGVLHIRADETADYSNERLITLVGPPISDTFTGQLATVVPDDRAVLFGAVRTALAEGTDEDVEVTFRPAGQPARRCVVSTRALLAEGGAVAGAILCVADITADVSLRDELRRRATYDLLTGCLNHSSMLASVTAMLAAPVPGTWVAVLFVDVNQFKSINDTFGHPAGDKVLQHVAGRLRSVCRPDDLVGRLGGDEFLVAVRTPEDPRALEQIVTRVRGALKASILLDGKRVAPTASLGVAYTPNAASTEALIAAADTAMYESKRDGLAGAGIRRVVEAGPITG